MQNEVDLIPVKGLCEKYSLGKTQFYSRMKELGIVTEKIGTQSYISPVEVEILDDLHEHILKGGNTPDFVAKLRGIEPQTKIIKRSEVGLERLPSREKIPAELLMRAVELLAGNKPQDALLPQKQLQEAADRGWVLGTKQLKEILGQTPQEREYFSFKVVRYGRSGRGHEIGWKVERPHD